MFMCYKSSSSACERMYFILFFEKTVFIVKDTSKAPIKVNEPQTNIQYVDYMRIYKYILLLYINI